MCFSLVYMSILYNIVLGFGGCEVDELVCVNVTVGACFGLSRLGPTEFVTIGIILETQS